MGTLLNRRRYMGGGSSLPYDAEIYYLEGTGTQYIDTGIIPTMSTGVTGTASFTYVGRTDYYFVGMREGSGNTRFWAGSASYYIRGSIGGFQESSIRVNAGDLMDFSFNYNGDHTMSWGNDSYSFTATSFNATRTMYMFCVNNQGTPNYFAHIRIYSMKIFSGTTIVRDFIPVRVGQTGYMYDKVSKQLFGNLGTGDFNLGPDKT